jgi:hypothetical protein
LTTLALIVLVGALVELYRQSPPLRQLVFGVLLLAICLLEYRPSLPCRQLVRQLQDVETSERETTEPDSERHAAGYRVDVGI